MITVFDEQGLFLIQRYFSDVDYLSVTVMMHPQHDIYFVCVNVP